MRVFYALMMYNREEMGRKEWDRSRRARESLRRNIKKPLWCEESGLEGEELHGALLWSIESLFDIY